jgi:hypothetical protein
VLRFAPDEALVTGDVAPGLVAGLDPHAIVERESGFVAAWLPVSEALPLLARTCAFELPRERPAFAQGSVAEIPVKLWLETDRILLLAPRPFAADLEERLA